MYDPREIGVLLLCRRRHGWIALVVLLSVLLTPGTDVAAAAVKEKYTIQSLGFTGGIYQQVDGNEHSGVQFFTRTGLVVGTSTRFNGTSHAGQAIWIDDGSGPTQLGFTGGIYQRSDGWEQSYARFLNEAGQVVGESRHYNGLNGTVWWIDDGSGPRRLGFTGGIYQRSDGVEFSEVHYLNEAGQTVGYSRDFDANSIYTDSVPWIDKGSGPIRLGYYGNGYVGYGSVTGLNEAGQAIGQSIASYIGPFASWMAWMDDGSGPTRLGLTGTGYQRSDGVQGSFATLINEAGQVVGYSGRYDGAQDLGNAVWIDNGSGATRLGLTGGQYQHAYGDESSEALFLNEAGQVVGTSRRFNGTTGAGQAVWLDDGTGPTRLGFTGGAYQRSDGYELSEVEFFNEAGQAYGYSRQYNGMASTGQAAWIDDGSGPIRLGFTGGTYQRSDGWERSEAQFVNEAGQVAGFSTRYSGTDNNGQAGWFYDPQTGETHELVFSVRDDGFARTEIQLLTDDGVAFGKYRVYDGSTRLSDIFFAWDPVHGLVNLTERITNYSEEDWGDMTTILGMSENGFLIGDGYKEGSEFAFLLVPEPATASLLLAPAGFLLRPRRQ